MSDSERVTAVVRALLERSAGLGVNELELRQDGIRVRVVRNATAAPAPAAPAAPAAASGPVLPTSAVTVAPRSDTKARTVEAPLTGIFYRSASPEAAPFVEAGSVIVPGDVIGLIEAMKLFNEIKAKVGGRVKRVVAENGQLVRAHSPLIELE